MKKFVLGSLTGLFLVSAFSLSAWAEEPEKIDYDIEEKTLLEERVRIANEFTEIKVKEGVIFKVETMPERMVMLDALGLRDLKDLSTFAAPEERMQLRQMGIDVPESGFNDPNPLEAYEGMDEVAKTRFEKARLLYLGMAAKALHNAKFAIGSGMVVGDSFSYISAKIRGRTVHTEKDPLRREKAIQKVLTSLNYQLFMQAPLVANSNEVGVVLSVGGIAAGGVKNKGIGGIIETGLLLGFNKDNKSVVVEHFIAPERFMHTVSVVAVGGLNVKAGIFLASRERGAETSHRSGISFYPPAVPGFSSFGQRTFMAGFSSGITFPPSPFSDLMTFTNSHNEYVTLRVEVSKVFKGFVRISTGPYGQMLKPVFISIKEYIADLRYGIAHLRGRTCAQTLLIL